MDTIKKTLRDSAAARWIALLIISLVMFAAYVTSDIFAPLQTMLEENNLWNSVEFGWFAGSYSIFNVFLGMLIFGGFILDKKGSKIYRNVIMRSNGNRHCNQVLCSSLHTRH
jgi:MFS family permease